MLRARLGVGLKRSMTLIGCWSRWKRVSGRLKAGGVGQLLAERDRVILLLMKASGWEAARVLQLRCADRVSVLGQVGRCWPGVQWPFLRYLQVIRPALVREERCEALFVGNGKDGISVDALAYRLKSLRALGVSNEPALFDLCLQLMAFLAFQIGVEHEAAFIDPLEAQHHAYRRHPVCAN